MKKYKAIFFDWDGTAVQTRNASVDTIAAAMKQLLEKDVKLIIVSGTTYDNIGNGKLHEYFSKEELRNLFMGLGRGAYNYRFDEQGKPYIWKSKIPDKTTLIKIHRICFQVHEALLEKYNFPTDIIFTRPNYCKIDLMVETNRGDNLFFQENELTILKKNLELCGFMGGLKGLLELSEQIAKEFEMDLAATTDAKYLEIGLSSKSDNVNTILYYLMETCHIRPENCAYWGDEYIGLDDGLFGSDSYMKTPITENGDFYDVSEAEGKRPEGVLKIGGGMERFIEFLREQSI